MKLKKLIMCGFKSFVDRTEMDFDDGISCIVGPNGCGKSNVVDAMKWVLGEQSAKSLRGTEMMDVIFNGSSARRASGSAEVTLVFDNADGTLQPEVKVKSDNMGGDVVSITRRLYRSGQSEYLINKTPTRLRDVREMFMDTGLGKDAYSVIEQGKVEAFLQANQDERRAIFDEAAGISKYKARKKEAMRKLDRAEQNLLRVNDVLSEVAKRLRSIKYQAGKARNYQAYSKQLGELKSLHLLAQYHDLSGRRIDLQGGVDAQTDLLASIQTKINQLDATGSAAEVESVELERTARELQGNIAAIDARITASQERAEMLAQKTDELGRQIVAISARNEELEAKIDTCGKDITDRTEALQAAGSEVERLEAQHQTLREEYATGELAVANLQAALAEEKAGIIDLLRRTSHLNNEVQASRLQQENLTARKMRLSERSEQLAQTIRTLGTERSETQRQASEARARVETARDKLDKADENSRKLNDDEQALRAQLAEAREQRTATASRIKALSEMQQRLEGVAAGVQRVLQAVDSGSLTAIRGMLGDCIRTDVQYAPVVEAALAGADQLLVADSFAQLQDERDAIAEVITEGGAVEIAALDRVGPYACDFDAARCEHVIARAIDWVRFEAPMAPLVWSVLGKTMVVADLAAAAAAARGAPGDVRFVTLGGEVLEADGRVRMGAANRSAGVVARRSELTALEAKCKESDGRIAELESQCRDAHDEIKQLEDRRQALRTEIYEANTNRVRCDSRLAQLDEQLDQARREQPVIAEDIRGLDQEIQAAAKRRLEAAEKADELKQLNTQREQDAERLEGEISSATQRQSALADRLTELRVSIASNEQKKLALREALGGLNRHREQMAKDLETGTQEIDLNRKRRADAEQGVQAAREETDRLYASQQEMNLEAQDVEETRQGLREKVDSVRQELSRQRQAHDEATESANAHRVSLGQIDTNIENLIARSQDDLSMDLIEAFASYEHDRQRDWDQVKVQIEELSAKINRLGNVNLDAISEQEELEKRHQFLSDQLKDIDHSRRQLNDLIARINRESRELFAKTFELVRENFQELFRKLFGGGRADIMLTDPEDVLESGIEIVARPPGKELRRLTLLSGGEKTMTALALLFSVFKARPSPFCLLDEVDAALDEANTERFGNLLSEFVQRSQFIVISHAKRTMSMANVLYGVTMQEPGVSKRISVRFEDAGNKLDTALEPVG